ncbi:MAG: restriction endonuclease [Spirochaetes bacterium]|nr:restriction endonuclease [Spirochaetota bacterium]
MTYKGPKFMQYCLPIINILKDLGGSGNPSEVTDLVIERCNISDEDQAVTNKNGGSKVKNQIAWARFYLVKFGILESDSYGIWSIDKKYLTTDFTNEDLLIRFKQFHKEYHKLRKGNSEQEDAHEEDSEDDSPEEVSVKNYREELFNIIQTISPNGFERLCQKLLRAAGFENVNVTGRSNDGGIDGHGIVKVNAFVNFKVVFQCKRYKGSVSPSIVRDFRGSMDGRADKGIIITTGTFTSEAKKEAQREGAIPIELVDGESMINLFEKLLFGLKEIKTYAVDYSFFEEFKL